MLGGAAKERATAEAVRGVAMAREAMVAVVTVAAALAKAAVVAAAAVKVATRGSAARAHRPVLGRCRLKRWTGR